LEGFNWVFFNDVGIGITLIVVEIDQVGCPIILITLVAFWAVSGEVSYFSTLEAGVQGIPSGGSVPLRVVLGSVPLIAVRVPLSMEVIALIVSLAMVIPLSVVWCSVLINVHGDRGVIHPSWSVR